MSAVKTLPVRLHHYRTFVDEPAYAAVLAEIKANEVPGRGHPMHAIADPKNNADRVHNHGDVEEIEIELDHLFGNQLNTTDGRRVFDWWEGIVYVNGHRGRSRCGHWVEVTPELAEARMDCWKCGYCGERYGPNHKPLPGGGFCLACIGSPYLKTEDMYLLRLLPVIEPEPKREPLTDDEKAALMPVYLDKQTKRTEQEAVKLRVKILDEYSTAIQKATTERDGMIWLLDHGYNADNVIYYNHTGRFGFGWRSKLSAEVKDKLLDLLCEFQFPYTIEWTGGKIES